MHSQKIFQNILFSGKQIREQILGLILIQCSGLLGKLKSLLQLQKAEDGSQQFRNLAVMKCLKRLWQTCLSSAIWPL